MSKRFTAFLALLALSAPAFADELPMNTSGLPELKTKLENKKLPGFCEMRELTLKRLDPGVNWLLMRVAPQDVGGDDTSGTMLYALNDGRLKFEDTIFESSFTEMTQPSPTHPGVMEAVLEVESYDLDWDPNPKERFQGPYVFRTKMRLAVNQATGEMISVRYTREQKKKAFLVFPYWELVSSTFCE